MIERTPMILPWQKKVNSLCIGIAGCDGLGQQELAEQIRDFADVPLIPDGIKGYMENQRLIKGTMGKRQMLKMYMNVLSEKKAIERASTQFVAVGTVLDYVSAVLTEMASDPDLDGYLDSFMQECGIHACECYDVIFLMPYAQKRKGDDVARATAHMLTTQGAMETQPIVLLHPMQTDTLADQTAECLGIIEKVTEVKANVNAQLEGKKIPMSKRVN